MTAQPSCLVLVTGTLSFRELLPPDHAGVLNETPRLCSGLHETLYMTVAIPLLWGIPPHHETLRYAVVCFVSCWMHHDLDNSLADAVLQSHLVEVWWKRCTGSGSCINRLYSYVYLSVHQRNLYSF